MKSSAGTSFLLIISLIFLFMVGAITSLDGGFNFRFPGIKKNFIKNYTVDPRVNKNCTQRFPQFSEFHSCLLSENSDPDILIIGDSHGNQYYQSIKEAFKNQVVMNISEYVCLPFVSSSIIKQSPIDCTDKIEIVKTFVNNTPTLKKIYLIGYWQILTDIGSQSSSVSLDDVAMKKYFSFISNGIDFMRGISFTGAAITIFADNPNFDFDINLCTQIRFTKFLESSPKCSTSLESIKLKQRWSHDALQKILTSFPHVKYFDPNQYLCDTQNCSITIDSNPIYMDRNHLNYHGTDRVVRHLKPTVEF